MRCIIENKIEMKSCVLYERLIIQDVRKLRLSFFGTKRNELLRRQEALSHVCHLYGFHGRGQ